MTKAMKKAGQRRTFDTTSGFSGLSSDKDFYEVTFMRDISNYFSITPNGHERGLPLIIQLGDQLPYGNDPSDEVQLKLEVIRGVVKRQSLELSLGVVYKGNNLDDFAYVAIISDPSYKPGRKLTKITT